MASDPAKYTMIATIGSAIIAGVVALIVHFIPSSPGNHSAPTSTAVTATATATSNTTLETTVTSKGASNSTTVTSLKSKSMPDAPNGGIVVDFSWIETLHAPSGTVAAEPYLFKHYGITIRDKKPEKSLVVFQNNTGIYGGRAIYAEDSQNFLTQIKTGNVPATFTLVFRQPLKKISFSLPEFYPHEQGITHPAWSAHALDEYGNEVSSRRESLGRSYKSIPRQTYVLTAPGFTPIMALRFDSDPRLDGKPFAAFSAIVIDRLILYPWKATTK